MIIRSYEESDIEMCRLLWTEMVQRHREIYKDESIGSDNPGMEFDDHLKLVGPEKIWVAESDGNLLGLTSIIQKNEEGEIEPIIISKKYRGKGIGQLLLNHAIKEAKKLNILILSVKPVARNKEAISFFYDNGFQTLGHIQLFLPLDSSLSTYWKKGPDIYGKSFKY